MKLRYLGKTGMQVSLVGLGCNNFTGRIDAQASKKVIHKALDLGITFFDTADKYGVDAGSETVIGDSLGDRRKDVVLATKWGLPIGSDMTRRGSSRRYIMSAVEDSLKRLKTDWIDLYQAHVLDPATPVEETLRALDDLIHQGKVRYIGCSSFPSWRVVEALWTSKHLGLNPFVSCQDHYNLITRDIERDLLPAAQQYGMGLLPYYPLANGALSGKYKRNASMPDGARMTNDKAIAARFLTDASWAKLEQLDKFCSERNRSMLELAFSWLAAKPFVSSIIAGATKPEQLEMNARAIEWELSPDDLAKLDQITLQG